MCLHFHDFGRVINYQSPLFMQAYVIYTAFRIISIFFQFVLQKILNRHCLVSFHGTYLLVAKFHAVIIDKTNYQYSSNNLGLIYDFLNANKILVLSEAKWDQIITVSVSILLSRWSFIFDALAN